MRLRRTSIYGLSAIIYLATREDTSPATVQEISEATRIPVEYLRKLLGRLVRGRLVRSIRGRHGGFQMAVPPGDITLLNIVEAIEGPIDESAIFDGDAVGIEDPNVVQALDRWRRNALHAMRQLLAGTTVQNLLPQSANRE